MSKQPDLFDPPPEPPPNNGWAGAVEGMKRAAAHADNEVPDWQARARSFLARYIAAALPVTLIAPDVRKWAESNGLEQPPNGHAWGQVFRSASLDKVLVADGFANYGDDVTHTHPVRVWRVV